MLSLRTSVNIGAIISAIISFNTVHGGDTWVEDALSLLRPLPYQPGLPPFGRQDSARCEMIWQDEFSLMSQDAL